MERSGLGRPPDRRRCRGHRARQGIEPVDGHAEHAPAESLDNLAKDSVG
jgi:hypothetical protein